MGSCLAGGMALGAASWHLAAFISGTFEPYDSGMGLAITQALLIPVSFLMGLKRGFTASAIFVAGAYLGLNIYPYISGSGETRAWALLGLFSSLILVIIPFLIGLAGASLKRLKLL
jgi:hypothetical protein